MRDWGLSPELEELRAAAERLGRAELAPAVRESEATGAWPARAVAVLDELPLGGLDVPVPLGGVDAGAVAKVVVLETLASFDAAGLAAVDRPGIAVGAVLACPDAALAAGASTACWFTVADGERASSTLDWAPGWPAVRWVWAMAGDELRLHEVTDPHALIDEVVLAFQASGAVRLDLSAAPCRGSWPLCAGAALDVRGRARLWSAAVAVGVAQAALDETIAYTTERVVFGKPVAHHQGNAFDLAHAASRVHGARLVVREAAASFDRGEPYAGWWATQAWLETMDAAFEATNVGIQLLGGHGFIVDHLAEKRFREARMLALLAGGRDAAEADAAAHTLDVPDVLVGDSGVRP